jgi:hypothetical protein
LHGEDVASLKWLVGGILALCVAQAADAGNSPLRLAPGDRLRITTDVRREEVVVQEVFQDRLAIRGENPDLTSIVLLSELRGLDLRARRSRVRGAYHGLDLGLPAGVFTGLAAGLAMGDDAADGSNLIHMSAREKAVVLAVVGGVGGMLLGSIIGSLWPGEEWKAVELPVTLDVGAANGVGAGISLRLAY